MSDNTPNEDAPEEVEEASVTVAPIGSLESMSRDVLIAELRDLESDYAYLKRELTHARSMLRAAVFGINANAEILEEATFFKRKRAMKGVAEDLRAGTGVISEYVQDKPMSALDAMIASLYEE